jgi:predicted deacetylase
MNLNISIDDVSPHPKSSTKVLERCFSLIQKFANIKFTLFVPLAYWRRRPSIATGSPLYISDYPEFCKEIKDLPKSNFEIGYHSYYHGESKQNDNDEFKSLSYEEALERFNLMFKEASKAGLRKVFSPLFRPPAWKISDGSVKAALDSGIKTLALFSKDPYLQKQFCIHYPNIDNGLKINYASSFPPIKEIFPEENNNIVYHACEWDKNYFSVELENQLSTFIETNISDIKFKFIHEK